MFAARPIWRSLPCVLLPLSILISCGDSENGSKTPEVVMNSPSKPASESIRHRAIRVSDVQTMPDRPIAAGTAIVVPAERVAAFWRSVGQPSAGPPTPGKAEFVVASSALANGAHAAPIQDGSFTSEVGAGALVCLADDLPSDDQRPPHRVHGCGTVPPGATGAIQISTGIAGVQIGLW
jgi:hypothetical protein